MGFGWLLLGYFVSTFMTLNQFGSILRCLGYGIILCAAGKLRRYHNAFGMMGLCAIAMLCVSGVLAFADVTEFLYGQAILSTRFVGEGLREGIGYAEQLVSLLFQTSMLFAIRAIAKETEVKKISDNAVRNFVFLCMYYAVLVVNLFLRTENVRLIAALSGIGWILYLAWLLLNHLLIFSCYMWICDEEDVEMAQKPSRFAFVNRFREKNEQKSQKAMAEYEAYRLEKKQKKERRKKGGR